MKLPTKYVKPWQAENHNCDNFIKSDERVKKPNYYIEKFYLVIYYPTSFKSRLSMGIIVSYSSSSRSLQNAVYGQMNQIADSTVALISSWIERNKLDIENWAELDMFQNSLPDDLMGTTARKSASIQLAKWQEQYKIYESLVSAASFLPLWIWGLSVPGLSTA